MLDDHFFGDRFDMNGDGELDRFESFMDFNEYESQFEDDESFRDEDFEDDDYHRPTKNIDYDDDEDDDWDDFED